MACISSSRKQQEPAGIIYSHPMNFVCLKKIKSPSKHTNPETHVLATGMDSPLQGSALPSARAVVWPFTFVCEILAWKQPRPHSHPHTVLPCQPGVDCSLNVPAFPLSGHRFCEEGTHLALSGACGCSQKGLSILNKKRKPLKDQSVLKNCSDAT